MKPTAYILLILTLSSCATTNSPVSQAKGQPPAVGNEDRTKMKDQTMKDHSSHSAAPAGWLHPFVRLWRRMRQPKPVGPCRFCGQPTSSTNAFNSEYFRHEYCRDKWRVEQAQEARDRVQIELFKRAIREVEQEKPNGRLQPPRREDS